jgi:hypothetical protein
MTIPPDAYTRAGDLKGAIDQDAEGVFKRFPAEQTAMQTLFQRITERGDGEKPIRKPETMSVLSDITGLTTARLQEIVEAFHGRGACWSKGRSRMGKLKSTFRTSVSHGSGSG